MKGLLVWEGWWGPMRAPCGEGPIGADWRDCRPAPSSLLRRFSGEERSGGAGVGGQPVEVFVGKRFCGVAGCVDDADGVGVVEDRDGEGVRPAGVRAGLGKACGGR